MCVVQVCVCVFVCVCEMCHLICVSCGFCVVLQYDPESSGFISTERFRDLLAAHGSELDPHKLEMLLALADANGKICYQDFVNLVSKCSLFPWRRAYCERHLVD